MGENLMVEEKPLSERPLFWRFKNDCAIRRGPWKLINNKCQSLFHLDDDIGETTNIIQKEPKQGKRLQQELVKWSNRISEGIKQQS